MDNNRQLRSIGWKPFLEQQVAPDVLGTVVVARVVDPFRRLTPPGYELSPLRGWVLPIITAGQASRGTQYMSVTPATIRGHKPQPQNQRTGSQTTRE